MAAATQLEATHLPIKEIAKEPGSGNSATGGSTAASCFSGIGVWMRTKPEGPAMATRRAAALGELARQFTAAAPPELLRLFPQWPTEFPTVLAAQDVFQLMQGMRGVEQAMRHDQQQTSAIAFQFAKTAFKAALEVHSLLGDDDPRKSGGQGSRPSSGQSSPRVNESMLAEPNAAMKLAEALISQTPVHVRHAFKDFETDLRALLSRWPSPPQPLNLPPSVSWPQR